MTDNTDLNYGAPVSQLHRLVAQYRAQAQGYVKASELLLREAQTIEDRGFNYPPADGYVSLSTTHPSPAEYLKAAGDPYWRSALGANDVGDEMALIAAVREQTDAVAAAQDSIDDPAYDFLDYGFGLPLNDLDEDTRTEIAHLLRRVFILFRDGFTWDTAVSTHTSERGCFGDAVKKYAFIFANSKPDHSDDWADEAPILIQITPEDITQAVKTMLTWCDRRWYEEDYEEEFLEPPYIIRHESQSEVEQLNRQLGVWLDVLKEAQDLVLSVKVAPPEDDI